LLCWLWVLVLLSVWTRDRSQKLAKMEERRAQRWENEQKSAIDARTTQLTGLVDTASRQLAVAKDAHKTAATRVNADLEVTRQVAKQLEENLEENVVERTRAVLELKNNISVVKAELVTQSDRKQRKIREAKQQLEDEKESMLSKGLNPYAEFRRKELNAESHRN
jgi:molybdenum-dependent DNA-binding transcriptional regulator ModE